MITRTVLRDKKGFTLVEVMIALVVLLLVSLALMQTALVGIDSNMINVLRDEAIGIAEMEMDMARNLRFDSSVDLLVGSPPTVVPRDIRSIIGFRYTVTRTVNAVATDSLGNTISKRILIRVDWQWRDNPYVHIITTIRRRS